MGLARVVQPQRAVVSLPLGTCTTGTLMQSCFASKEGRSRGAPGRAMVQATELSSSLSKHLQCLSFTFPRAVAAL